MHEDPSMLQQRLNQDLLPDAKRGQSNSRPRPLNGSTPTFNPSQADIPASLGRLLQVYPCLQRHPHPFLVHFSIVFIYAAVFLSLLFLVLGHTELEISAFYCVARASFFCRR